MDDDEDRRYGKDKRGDELPEELAFRESRLRKIREAKAALEAEALAEAGQAEREGRNHPGVPDDKAQRNFTDPDSRIMPAPGGRDFQQSYNCQAVVDSAHQVIVAARATNQPSDKGQAVSMIEETVNNTGAVPKEVSADAGYYSAKAVDGLYNLGVDPFVAPEKTRHGWVPPPAPRGRIPKGLSVRDRMRRKLRTKRGRERYALRMETVEPVFGQIKQGRGFRQFLLRGLAKVNREWHLICTGHNLLKLFPYGAGRAGNGRDTGRTPTPAVYSRPGVNEPLLFGRGQDADGEAATPGDQHPVPARTGEKPLDVGLREVEGLSDRSQRRRILLQEELEGRVLEQSAGPRRRGAPQALPGTPLKRPTPGQRPGRGRLDGAQPGSLEGLPAEAGAVAPGVARGSSMR